MKKRTRKLTWAKRITAAKKRGHFTERERQLAGMWNCCAIGEAVGYPATEHLAFKLMGTKPLLERTDAGIAFCNAVGKNDFASARKILSEIRALAK